MVGVDSDDIVRGSGTSQAGRRRYLDPDRFASVVVDDVSRPSLQPT